MKLYEKSRPIIQIYNDEDKAIILTWSFIILRVILGLIMALLSLNLSKKIKAVIRDISQAYPLFITELKREIKVYFLKELRDKNF